MLAAVKSFGRSAFGVESAEAAADETGLSASPTARPEARPVILWVPFAMVAGIWLYFGLPQEPQVWTAWLAMALAMLILWRARLRGALVLLAVVLAGFGLAKMRSDHVATPLITARSSEVLVIGTLESRVQRSAKRADLVVSPEQVETLAAGKMPRRLRLTAYGNTDNLEAGNRVAFKARLWPIPGPAMPGGFDYGRQLFFAGIGGLGRVSGEITVVGENDKLSLMLARASVFGA